MHRSVRLAGLALVTTVVSLVSLVTPAQAQSGFVVKRIFQTGSNTTSMAFNPVVDSQGRYAFGEFWARANCTNVTVQMFFNPYMETLASDRGYLRMLQMYMTPSQGFDMYQATTTYWPVGGGLTAGPRQGYTGFAGGRQSAVSLPFNRTVALDRSGRWVGLETTLIAQRDASEPYCAIKLQPTWYRS